MNPDGIMHGYARYGEWEIWKANRWYVDRRTGSDSFTRFGPYDTKQEAIEKSGMPKPKTELEEVWEVSREMRNALCRLAAIIADKGHFDAFNEAIEAKLCFDRLVTKYEKHLKA